MWNQIQSSLPPASSTRPRRVGSADSRSASTQPAEPAPTTMTSAEVEMARARLLVRLAWRAVLRRARRAGRDAQGAHPILTVRAGAVRVRHQAAMSFDLSYAGDRPMLLYVFQAPRSAAEQGCRPGAFALLKPGTSLEIHHPEPMEVLAVAYDGDRDLVLGDMEDAPPGASDPGVRLLAQEIRRVLREEDASDPRYVETLAESLLVRAAAVAASPQSAAATRALTPHKLRRLTAFIDANLDRPLQVAELAAVVGLSRAHFTRAFQSAVGQTPHRFVLSRRLEEVRSALEA